MPQKPGLSSACHAIMVYSARVTLSEHPAVSAADDHYHFRTIWISDIHLGTPGCQAYYLLDFLRTHKANTLYLIGDILDGWQLKKSWYWPQAHNDVVQKIRRS